LYKKGYEDPAAPTTIDREDTISGIISIGMPITISLSSIPENFLEPSHPREKLGDPER
jgi:hypothetical protein